MPGEASASSSLVARHRESDRHGSAPACGHVSGAMRRVTPPVAVRGSLITRWWDRIFVILLPSDLPEKERLGGASPSRPLHSREPRLLGIAGNSSFRWLTDATSKNGRPRPTWRRLPRSNRRTRLGATPSSRSVGGTISRRTRMWGLTRVGAAAISQARTPMGAPSRRQLGLGPTGIPREPHRHAIALLPSTSGRRARQ